MHDRREPTFPDIDWSKIPRHHELQLNNRDGSWRPLHELVNEIIEHRLAHTENPEAAASSLGLGIAELHRMRSDMGADSVQRTLNELKRTARAD